MTYDCTLIALFVASFLFMYVCSKVPSLNKMMKGHVATLSFDCWSLVHFGLYVIVAFNLPNSELLVFTWSIVFEIYEAAMGRLVASDTTYWYGRPQDILVNMFGYALGQGIRPYVIGV